MDWNYAFPHPPLSFLMVRPEQVIHHLHVLALYHVGVFLIYCKNHPPLPLNWYLYA